jgi:predicted O-methyltransferase YrrM
MSKFKTALRYLKYLRKGKSKYFIHSPFVFEFVDEVLFNKHHFYAYDEVEKRRDLLLISDRKVTVTDFGAGSRVNNDLVKPVSQIAKNAAKPKKYGQLLHRIVSHYQPETMLELGTSLGITSMYEASANKSGKLYTHEGCPETAKIAHGIFHAYPLKNIEIVVGDFAKTLDNTLSKIDKIDYAFFDGNHQKIPTLEYFEKSLEKAHDQTLFIFDDIHWSDEMEEAWETIKEHPRVTVTIDLFFIGLVFFKPDQAKEDFIIRY